MIRSSRAASRARNFAVNTCSASRHLHMMADALRKRGKYLMLAEEPEHCAESIYSVLESLWEARTALQSIRPAGIDKGAEGWWWKTAAGKRALKAMAKGK